MISQWDYDVYKAKCELWFEGIRLNPLDEIPLFPEFPSMPQPEAENMIDKLDKWKQRISNGKNCHCLFNEQNEPIRICAFHSRWKKEAVADEREACAKLCEDKGFIDGRYPGGFLAELIRERSDK